MKITFYAYHEQWTGFQDEEKKIVFRHNKIANETAGAFFRFFIGEAQVEVPDIPLLSEDEVKTRMIVGLRESAEKVQSDAFMEVKAIEERIQQLLCLTHKEEL